MITNHFLGEVARFVDAKVAKVVINESYTITEFETKAVTANVMAINYIVPVADVSLITLIELKDSSDHTISSNNVNIPIMTDHLMIQTIEVKEAP